MSQENPASSSEDEVLSQDKPAAAPMSGAPPANSLKTVSVAQQRDSEIYTRLGHALEHEDFLYMEDDSMEPTIDEGALLILDTSYNNVSELAAGIYALKTDSKVHVRRLDPLPNGKIVVSADNQRYRSLTIDPRRHREDMFLLGKIILVTQKP
ncbi:MAG: helix-turn-helix transcriptional regulator [Leptolyngbya sp. BL-A-14]